MGEHAGDGVVDCLIRICDDEGGGAGLEEGEGGGIGSVQGAEEIATGDDVGEFAGGIEEGPRLMWRRWRDRGGRGGRRDRTGCQRRRAS